ncbi:MAG: sulfatase [Proteobacteria bacterium]|nr:sulfatase [Pseudomonadota bacterium]MCP4919746.1 sulfatase [Pseudomonadota bacterium]
MLYALLGSALAQDPDVLVFVLDTMRADHLDLEGDATPELRALAESGVVYTNAHSVSSWTPPAVMSLMTGQYATTHGVVEGPIPARARAEEEGRTVLPLPVLDKKTSTVAQRFRREGYQTAGVTTNHLIDGPQGFSRGFTLYEKLGVDDSIVHDGPEHVDEGPQQWSLEARGMAPAPAEVVHGQLMDWKDELDTDARPDFVWVHLMDAHMPYRRHGDPDADLQTAYASEIAYMDRWIGRIVRDLEMQDAIIVVVSDHGDAFGEHGAWGHGGDTRTYAEVNDVVLFMTGPGLPAGEIVHEPVSQVDVVPTLASLAGLEKHRNGVEGVDLTRGLPERPVFGYRGGLTSVDQGSWMVVRDDWKLMEWNGGSALYRDGDETSSLLVQKPDLARRLGADLDDYRSSVVLREPDMVEVDADEDTLQGLRALGYLD